MKKSKEQPKKFNFKPIGFFFECLSFIFGGILIGQYNPGGFIFLLIGFILAYFVGKQIKKDAINEYLKKKRWERQKLKRH